MRCLTPADGLTRGEREVLEAIVYLHGEFQEAAYFTRDAIELTINRPAAGSLGTLAMLGFIEQRAAGDEGTKYRVLPRGLDEAAKRLGEPYGGQW